MQSIHIIHRLTSRNDAKRETAPPEGEVDFQSEQNLRVLESRVGGSNSKRRLSNAPHPVIKHSQCPAQADNRPLPQGARRKHVSCYSNQQTSSRKDCPKRDKPKMLKRVQHDDGVCKFYVNSRLGCCWVRKPNLLYTSTNSHIKQKIDCFEMQTLHIIHA